ncbi:MAG TPA: hypothetical protein VFP05_09035 [Thermomicrobiales bacterium]|nr:hypothetical protein [Thermomicrobiales bacterium]
MNRTPFFRRHLRTIGLATVLTISAMALPLSGTLAQGGVQIQILGQGVQATAGGGNLVDPVTSVSTTVTLAASEWTGGYYQGNGAWYGRPWTALYGSQTQYSTASITVQLGSTPTAPVTLTLVGLNDESGNKNPIQITVNGTTIFNGTSWFASWDGQGQGQNAPWTSVAITIPTSFFSVGANSVVVSNLSNSSNFSMPPYVLLGAAQLNLPGASASVN